MIQHLVIAVDLSTPEEWVYLCQCGVKRVGSEAMNEHLDANEFRAFTAAALAQKVVWILGRRVQL